MGEWEFAFCPFPTELRWGAPDRYSVMAYCSGGPTALNPRDVAGIQRAYERHLSGTLLSLPGSLCLSGHANAPNGANAFGWECDESNDDQEWHYDPTNRSLFIQWPSDPTHTRRCLDVDTANYTDVQIWNCLNGPNQQWSFQKTTLRGHGGLCLTMPVSGVGALTMQPCTLKQIYLPLLSKSAGSTGPVSSGSAPTLSPSGPINWIRDFYMGPGGLIGVPSLTSDSLCLDVQDVWDSDFTTGKGGPVAGQRVQFFKCYSTQLNQKGTLTGAVVSGNQCLALSGTATVNGSGAKVMSCSSAPEQDWDYV